MNEQHYYNAVEIYMVGILEFCTIGKSVNA